MALKITSRFRRLLQRPGSIDLGPYERLSQLVLEAEKTVEPLTDEELTESVGELRTTGGLHEDEQIEFLALARDAARRTLGESAFDGQIVGALAMLQGRVVEMATGEGKTLAGAFAAAGYAVGGRKVHVLAVNDYLARRDAEWMAPVYELLGVTVAHVGQASTPEERRAAYQAEVCYVPVSEVGFDVLRDRLVADVEERVTAEPDVALVDEADSVLIDEARVPLVLAGATRTEELDDDVVQIVRTLRAGVDYEIDGDGRTVALTDAGTDKVEKLLGERATAAAAEAPAETEAEDEEAGEVEEKAEPEAVQVNLYDDENLDRLTQINVALHAEVLLRKDVDYLVRDGKVSLINNNRGRIAKLQRWPDGLQAAVEAKEAVPVSDSGEILDSITVQALIKGYKSLCGMTGTAVVVGESLQEFYEVEVAVVPPNNPNIRKDDVDRLYLTVDQKNAALVEHIAEVHETGRPILIGTHSVEESEQLSDKLEAAGIPHVVLNAKNDAEEAAIIAEAGVPGTVTVSTQMAGRGTDIRLGGKDESHDKEKALELGGLYVVGTGLHASRRLDDQLRGRAGRQGDPGGSLFFASLGDELVTRYSVSSGLRPHPDKTGRLTDRKSIGMLDHAQRVADGANAELHRTTWQYHRLTGQQRAILLDTREQVLTEGLAATELSERVKERYDELVEEHGEDVVKDAARRIALHHLDRRWTDHLAYLADLREGIHLRSLAGGIVHMKPIDEFNKSAIASFDTLVADAWTDAAETFATAEISAAGLDEAASGVPRPTATWTYLVNDNPFGTEADRILGRLRNALRPQSGAQPEEIPDEHFDETDLPEELRDAADEDLPEELREAPDDEDPKKK
ncbi:accessory Sec system translocase SecA2 [Kribbella sandramycini]|uniref:Protein translocase subunit SecA n=1 Tax=Kribbella sandramycini TaxID=60450 RepID=A0A7Y4P2H0_9ACTN|nr:accessory Sec system translocase SecA2 [Kribbella sandramycini]MBB6570152.1 preprotein translocase subunit SecA [Kribbella sandramycini]NOL45347.1 accessory Sec system translocase SecA2 [Kribbella sandramycini]